MSRCRRPLQWVRRRFQICIIAREPPASLRWLLGLCLAILLLCVTCHISALRFFLFFYGTSSRAGLLLLFGFLGPVPLLRLYAYVHSPFYRTCSVLSGCACCCAWTILRCCTRVFVRPVYPNYPQSSKLGPFLISSKYRILITASSPCPCFVPSIGVVFLRMCAIIGTHINLCLLVSPWSLSLPLSV